MSTPTQTPAGWYDDGSGKQRWWDGQQWASNPESGPAPSAVVAGQGNAKGLALIALIVGLFAFLVGLVPVFGAIVGITAIVFALLALRNRQPKGLSIAGIILGGVAILASIGMTIGVASSGPSPDTVARPLVQTSQPSVEPVPEEPTTEVVEDEPKPVVEPEPTTEPSSTPDAEPEPAEEVDTEPELTMGQANAVETAESYLDYSGFSRKGLIGQLKFEGYSKNEATFAVDYLHTNWNEQAAIVAESYLDYSSFSRSGLIDQLKYEGFTKKQAKYGASAVGY